MPRQLYAWQTDEYGIDADFFNWLRCLSHLFLEHSLLKGARDRCSQVGRLVFSYERSSIIIIPRIINVIFAASCFASFRADVFFHMCM